MIGLERFDQDIMSSTSYYETLNYVSDYVQNFLVNVLDKDIRLPISVDALLKNLGISIEETQYHNFKNVASIYFNATTPYIQMAPNIPCYLSNWLKLKCISKYILKLSDIIDEKRVIFALPEICLKTSGEALSDMIASELMLPYKQSVDFLKEQNFFRELNNRYLWLKYGELAIGYCIKIDYPLERKTFSYYHLLSVLEAKNKLGVIDKEKYNSFQKSILDFIDLDFSSDISNCDIPFYAKHSSSITDDIVSFSNIVSAMCDPFDT